MFKKSFLKEIGKNTGKWASNKIFGDNWSTPFRFSNSNTNMAKEALKIEKEISEQNLSNELEFLEMKNLINQSKDYEKKKQEIIDMLIPNEKDTLFQFTNFLLSNIYGAGWGNDNDYKHLNSFSNACLIKLKQCKMKFKMMNATFHAQYVQKEISTLKRKRFFEKHGNILALIILMIICAIGLQITGTF